MRRRIIALLLALTMILSFTGALCAGVSSYADNTIIIAYIEDTNFINYENGIFSGYGVEFLDEISIYSKWHYKLLPCSKADALKGLDNGTVSLFIGISDEDPLRDEYLVSDESVMPVSSLLYVNSDNNNVWYDDYAHFDGLIIGFESASTIEDRFISFAENENLSFTSKYYPNYYSLHTALKNGEIDGAVVPGLKLFSDCKLVSNIGTGHYHAIASPKHEDVMRAFNEAYNSIIRRTPDFISSLYNKYYDSRPISSAPLYTREEVEYAKTHTWFNVGVYTTSIPLGYLDSDGSFQGLFPHLLKRISDISGIYFNPVAIDINNSPAESLSIDTPLIFGVGLSSDDIIDGKINYTLPICFINNILVTTDNQPINYSDATAIIPRSHYNVYHYLASHYPNLRINYCELITEALDAVFHGEADFTIANEYVLNYYTSSPKYGSLFIDSAFEYDEQYVFIASKTTDDILLSILNKTITHLKRTTIEEDIALILNNTRYSRTFFDILHTYSSQIIAFVALLSFMALLLFLEIRDKAMYKSAEKMASEYKAKAEVDSVTGLSTLNFFTEQMQTLLSLSEPVSYSLVAIKVRSCDLIIDLYGFDKWAEIVNYIAGLIKDSLPELFGLATKFSTSTIVTLLPTKCDAMELFGPEFLEKIDEFPLDTKIDTYVAVYNIDDHTCPADLMYEKLIGLVCSLCEKQGDPHLAIYGNDREIQLKQRRVILNNVERAFTEDGFSFNIQPKINLENEKIMGGEALIRWTIPGEGSISPSLFIPILEENGYITRLDLYILEKVCKLLRGYLDKGLKIVPISINLSSYDFYVPLFVEDVLKICEKYNIEHKYIEFEISEGIYNNDNKYVFAAVNNLRKEGFKITMDDFGCDYSTINMLKVAEIDNLKIDVKYIYKSDVNNRADKIISHMAELAGDLMFNLVAEEVETREQTEFLKSIGCTVAQGFYFSMPMRLEDFESYMNKNI